MYDSNYFADDNDDDFYQSVTWEEDNSLDTKWKGIQVADASLGVVFHDFRADESDPTFKFDSDVFMSNIAPKRSVAETAGGISEFIFDLPEVPIGVSSSKFEITYPSCAELERDLQTHLNSVAEFDFSFQKDDHMWKGKHLKGSCCMEVEVRLFCEPGSNSITISAGKIQGDALGGASFSEFYNNLQSRFDPTGFNKSSNTGAKKARRALPLPPMNFPTLSQPTDEEFLIGIEPVFKMAQEACFEPRLEAARMLNDIATKEIHFLELPVFQAGCLNALNTLLQDQFDQVRQHAIMAAAAFAQIPSYQEGIVMSRMLPILFSLIENCPAHATACDTAQIRRSASEVLSLLCQSYPYQVRTQLQQQHLCDVDGWITYTVPTLIDARTKECATLAATALSEVELSAADAAALHDEFSADALQSLIH